VDDGAILLFAGNVLPAENRFINSSNCFLLFRRELLVNLLPDIL